jgi:hypothetical protein
MPSIAHLRVEAPHDDRACDVKVLLKCAGFVCEFDGRFRAHNANNEVNSRQTTGPIRDNCAGSRPAAKFTQAALSAIALTRG